MIGCKKLLEKQKSKTNKKIANNHTLTEITMVKMMKVLIFLLYLLYAWYYHFHTFIDFLWCLRIHEMKQKKKWRKNDKEHKIINYDDDLYTYNVYISICKIVIKKYL